MGPGITLVASGQYRDEENELIDDTDGFVDALHLRQTRESRRDLVAGVDDLLTYFDRCRVMVQPEYLQPHSR